MNQNRRPALRRFAQKGIRGVSQRHFEQVFARAVEEVEDAHGKRDTCP